MGHCEMLLAVAGLEKQQISETTQRLGSGNWAVFTPAEQVGFSFAVKQAREPWKIDDADYQRLVDHFGTHRALDVVWWSSRCHYMTRVADAFQLPLEKTNVFAR